MRILIFYVIINWLPKATTLLIHVYPLMCLVAQLCPALCDPIDCSLPGSSFHGDSPGKNTIPSSRGSSQPKEQILVFHIAGRFFTNWATREAQEYWSG